MAWWNCLITFIKPLMVCSPYAAMLKSISVPFKTYSTLLAGNPYILNINGLMTVSLKTNTDSSAVSCFLHKGHRGFLQLPMHL